MDRKIKINEIGHRTQPEPEQKHGAIDRQPHAGYLGERFCPLLHPTSDGTHAQEIPWFCKDFAKRLQSAWLIFCAL
jgi:hypothetical protein